MVSAEQKWLVLSAASGVPDAAADAAASALVEAGAVAEGRQRLAGTAVQIGFSGGAAAPEISGIDANIVPEAGRRKRLLIADMDSTIIPVECIDELADFAGVRDEVAAVTDAAMRGELDFEAALLARVALLKGLSTDALQRCHDERVRLNPGARILVRTMVSLGAETALVSGGFTFFAGRVAEEAGFARFQANGLLEEDGALTGDVSRPILGREAKLVAMREIMARGEIGADEVLAVGDGANDLAMVAAAGLGVAYHAREALAREADAVLEHSDLTALLALQGIGDGEWVC